MHAYENTKFLKPYLESHGDQIRHGIEEAALGDDRVQVVADVLAEVLSQDPEVQSRHRAGHVGQPTGGFG